MDPQKWTEKTRSAISAAVEAAQAAGNPQIEPLHVAIAALEDSTGTGDGGEGGDGGDGGDGSDGGGRS